MYPFLSTTTTTGSQHMFLILPGESVNNLDPRRSREVPSQMWMQMGSKRVRKKRETRDICRAGSHFVRGGCLLVADDAPFDKKKKKKKEEEVFQDRAACIRGSLWH